MHIKNKVQLMQIQSQIIDSNYAPPPKPKQEIIKKQSIIDQQIQFISQKLTQLNIQSDFTSLELNKNINYLADGGDLQQKYLKSFFKRKYVEEIKLLKDFYENAYTKSFINCLLFCCKLNWQKKFRIYKYTDQSFEEAMEDLPSQRRNMFYFVNLLYIRLFIIYQENCAKIKQLKTIDPSKLINLMGQKVEQQKNEKQPKPQPQAQSQKDKATTNKENTLQELADLQKRKQQIQKLLQRDTKDLQNNKKNYSLNQEIKMVIEDQEQIQQLVRIQETKLKTQHFFADISTKSLDLRNFLIRKSRVQKNKFVFTPIYDNLIFFKFKFQFTNVQRLSQLQKKFQLFFLNSMRVAIKQKVIRMASQNQKIDQKILCLFLQLLQKQKSLINSQQFQSFQEKEDEVIQRFWFQELGNDLIKAIIQVSQQKIQQRHKKQSMLLMKRKKSSQHSKFKGPALQINIPNSSKKVKNPEQPGESSRQFLTNHQI